MCSEGPHAPVSPAFLRKSLGEKKENPNKRATIPSQHWMAVLSSPLRQAKVEFCFQYGCNSTHRMYYDHTGGISLNMVKPEMNTAVEYWILCPEYPTNRGEKAAGMILSNRPAAAVTASLSDISGALLARSCERGSIWGAELISNTASLSAHPNPFSLSLSQHHQFTHLKWHTELTNYNGDDLYYGLLMAL